MHYELKLNDKFIKEHEQDILMRLAINHKASEAMHIIKEFKCDETGFAIIHLEGDPVNLKMFVDLSHLKNEPRDRLRALLDEKKL